MQIVLVEGSERNSRLWIENGAIYFINPCSNGCGVGKHKLHCRFRRVPRRIIRQSDSVCRAFAKANPELVAASYCMKQGEA